MKQITVSEIREITDPEQLSALIDQLRTDLFAIEAQLEWKETDDTVWEGRAINALALHRVALGEALRRERKITGKSAANQKANAESKLAKAIKKETAAVHRTNDLEQRKLNEQRRRNDIHERSLALIASVSADAEFRRSARSILDAAIYDRIEAAAISRVAGAVKRAVVDMRPSDVLKAANSQSPDEERSDEVDAASASASLTHIYS